MPLGAVVGMLVNVLFFAPLGNQDLKPAAAEVQRLLATQMRSYAEMLEDQAMTGDDTEAADRRAGVVHGNVIQLEDGQARLRAALINARRGMKGNPRMRLNSEDPEAAREQPQLLLRIRHSIDSMLEQSRVLPGRAGLDDVLFGALAVAIQDCMRVFTRDVAEIEVADLEDFRADLKADDRKAGDRKDDQPG